MKLNVSDCRQTLPKEQCFKMSKIGGGLDESAVDLHGENRENVLIAMGEN